MTTITIKTNTKKLVSIMDSVSKWMKDFKKPFGEISKMQLREIDEAFNVDWRNINWTRWKKLKPATTRYKIKHNINKWILQSSWNMRKSFKKLLLTKNRLVIWNPKTYFKYSQQWTKNMAQRQSLWHGNIMIKRVQIEMNKYLLTLIRKWMK